MRTATTLIRTVKGWQLLAGPDVSADKQRANFNNIGAHWPAEALEVRYQSNDGPAKFATKEKAQSQVANTAAASKKADEKAAAALKAAQELKAKEEAEAKAKAAETAARAKAEAAAKEAAKKAAWKTELKPAK